MMQHDRQQTAADDDSSAKASTSSKNPDKPVPTPADVPLLLPADVPTAIGKPYTSDSLRAEVSELRKVGESLCSALASIEARLSSASEKVQSTDAEGATEDSTGVGVANTIELAAPSPAVLSATRPSCHAIQRSASSSSTHVARSTTSPRAAANPTTSRQRDSTKPAGDDGKTFFC
jgi:hypothetical protein